MDETKFHTVENPAFLQTILSDTELHTYCEIINVTLLKTISQFGIIQEEMTYSAQL